MNYSAVDSWNSVYLSGHHMAYPAEGVIRIFKGSFPTLKMPRPVAGQSIIDVGCGDGRHFPLFASLGLQSFGVEISESIVKNCALSLKKIGIDVEISLGSNAKLPFTENFSDYLLSWNSSYYMSLENASYSDHVSEFARVLKAGGWLVCSIPKESCFIFDKSEKSEFEGYRIIRNDFFQKRNGEVLRCFSGEEEIRSEFENDFTNFCFADIHMDWFGLSYHWHVFVAQKK